MRLLLHIKSPLNIKDRRKTKTDGHAMRFVHSLKEMIR